MSQFLAVVKIVDGVHSEDVVYAVSLEAAFDTAYQVALDEVKPLLSDDRLAPQDTCSIEIVVSRAVVAHFADIREYSMELSTDFKFFYQAVSDAVRLIALTAQNARVREENDRLEDDDQQMCE